jgi:hypothetical protein
VGSAGSKPRKPQHHLPKVGSPANQAYELRERRKEVFGGLPTVLWAVLVVLLIVSFVVITA